MTGKLKFIFKTIFKVCLAISSFQISSVCAEKKVESMLQMFDSLNTHGFMMENYVLFPLTFGFHCPPEFCVSTVPARF